MSDEPLPPVPHTYPAGCFFPTLADIKGKHVTVMGLGLNGGGEATVRFLLRHGALVTVTDMKTADELAATVASLQQDPSLPHENLRYVLGEHRAEDFANADCVIKNPGVKYDGNPYLAAARAIETDISLFLHFTCAPIIAVTGSKGKSSTVSAIHYGLCQAGFTAFLGGNITVSPLTFLDQTDESTPVILELSSWQLADLRGRKALKPKIALITKIIPDHQNFYHSMLAYVADKKLIYADQRKSDYTIVDFDDDPAADGGTLITNWGNVFAAETKATVLRYSKKPLPPSVRGIWQDAKGTGICRPPAALLSESARTRGKDTDTVLRDIAVPGKHMRLNVLNAALVMELMGVAPEKTIDILGRWNGIEHRLEFFHTWQNGNLTVRFYNDSAATVPEAAAESTQAFGEPVIFLTGGTDKGLDLSPIAQTLANPLAIQPSATYLLAGTATDKMLADFAARGIRHNGVYQSIDDMLARLKADIEAHKGARGSKVVVFSPGATSFGMFQNEFDRGRQFKEKVRSLFA